jgi:hypothetical protein
MKKAAYLMAPLLALALLANQRPDNRANGQATPDSFGHAEQLRYRIHYGLINAGVVTMNTDEAYASIGSQAAMHIRVEGETLKSFEWAYKVRDKFEAWVNPATVKPLRYAKTVRENTYYDQDLAVFNHAAGYLRNRKGQLSITTETRDIASAIYFLRTVNWSALSIGASKPVDVYLDNEVYNLSVAYAGKETIQTDLGPVRCLKLKPELVVDRVFKNKNGMTVWVSDDANRIPVRIQTDIQVGSLKVDLTEYSHLKNAFTALGS